MADTKEPADDKELADIDAEIAELAGTIKGLHDQIQDDGAGDSMDTAVVLESINVQEALLSNLKDRRAEVSGQPVE